MPGRSQKRQHDLAYAFLKDRDGEYCLGCLYHYQEFRGPPGEPLEIDHADNDPENWDPRNLHLLCKHCNIALRGKTSEEHLHLISIYSANGVRVRESARTGVPIPVVKKEKAGRKKGRQDSTRAVRQIVDYMAGPPEMQANSLFENKVRDSTLETLKLYETFDYYQLRDSVSEIVGCSIISTDRYYRKLFSASGPCRRFQDEGSGIWMATLRDNFKPVKRGRRKGEGKG